MHVFISFILFIMKLSKTNLFTSVSAIALLAIALTAAPADAAACTFTRALDLGVDGEDVRCLQKYLNGAGYKVADMGVGAPGSETTLFRDKTKAAVAKWQAANGISPASGIFGPLSQAKYKVVAGGTTITPGMPVTVTPTTPVTITPGASNAVIDSYKSQVASLTSQLAAAKANNSGNSNSSMSSAGKKASDQIKNAFDMIADAEDEIDDAEKDGMDVASAKCPPPHGRAWMGRRAASVRDI